MERKPASTSTSTSTSTSPAAAWPPARPRGRLRTGAFAVVLLALAFVAATLSSGYVSGAGPFWQHLQGDAAQGQIGWFYFARDDWRWPLLAIGTQHQPEGGNLLLSDGLPLLAVPAKALYRLAWPENAAPPIYLGLWVALCFFAQVLAAAGLLRALEVRRPLPFVSGLIVLSYVPPLFLRFGHATLLAHFLILLALTGYVANKRHGLPRRTWIGLCAIPVIALWITPYLAVMSGLLVAATILDAWRERRLAGRHVALALGSMSAAGLALIGASGVWALPAENFGDYGRHALNLLSPFVPFPGTASGRWLGTQHPALADTNGWEGGSYLGAGVLLLCAAAVPALRDWRANLRRHAVLAAILAAAMLFAVSHRIGIGSWQLVRLPLPDAAVAALSTLRGSGRFAWLAVYALTAAGIAAVLNRYRTPVATALLVAAAALQFADVAPMQAAVRAASATPGERQIDEDAWRDLIAAHERVFQFPSFGCGGLFSLGVPGTRWRVLQIDWVAARLDKPTNSAYLARQAKDCARERETALGGRREPGTLYLFRAAEDVGRLLAEHGEHSTGCGYLDDVVVCSADRDLSHLDQSVLAPRNDAGAVPLD